MHYGKLSGIIAVVLAGLHIPMKILYMPEKIGEKTISSLGIFYGKKLRWPAKFIAYLSTRRETDITGAKFQ